MVLEKTQEITSIFYPNLITDFKMCGYKVKFCNPITKHDWDQHHRKPDPESLGFLEGFPIEEY